MRKEKIGSNAMSQNCSVFPMESQLKLPEVDKSRNRVIYILFKVIMVNTSKT